MLLIILKMKLKVVTSLEKLRVCTLLGSLLYSHSAVILYLKLLRSRPSVSTRREPRRVQEELLITQYIKIETSLNGKTLKKKYTKVMFLGLRSIQINIEPTKASIGSYIDLPPISKTLNQY